MQVPKFDINNNGGDGTPIIKSLTVDGYLGNSTPTAIQAYIKVAATNEEHHWGSTYSPITSIGYGTVPPSTSCQIDIETVANASVTKEGGSTSMLIGSRGGGTGHVSFKPSETDGTWGVITNNGGDEIKYNVTDGSGNEIWNNSTGSWQGNLETDYYFQLQSDSASVKPGQYTGTMDAMLTCE